MVQLFRLTILSGNKGIDALDDIEECLQSQGCEVLYSTMEEGVIVFIIKTRSATPKELQIPGYTITHIEEERGFSIDWADQARLHCEVNDKGMIVVPLTAFGNISSNSNIYLFPGPTFGDTSQPTTSLVLSLLSKYVRDAYVIDIGSGSGILSCAAAKFGAKKVYGFEIDPEAVVLAGANVSENRLDDIIEIIDSRKEIRVKLPDDSTVVILCNMISSEQKVAFGMYKKYIDRASVLIASGILIEEKDVYYQFLKKMGFSVCEEIKSGEWLGLVCMKDT
jgi:ribosomal protein L11 methyltransferase